MSGFVCLILLLTVLLGLAGAAMSGVGQRARITKAKADVRALSRAVKAYATHVGRPPVNLVALTSPATNAQGKSAGPFIERIPVTPCGWAAGYRYEHRPDGTFAILAEGDFMTIKEP
jgi:type II secretory pathway pseudopilin PulG